MDHAPVALLNGRVLAGERLQDGLAVLLRDGRIEAVLDPDDARVRAVRPHDLGGALLLPGFVDVQVNGGGGVLFNDAPTVDSLRRIAAAHRRFGTTGLLPTLITDTPARMREALTAVEAAIADGVPGILGIHLEGPFLAATRKGIHDAGLFRSPDEDDLALLCTPRAGTTMLTVAPERIDRPTLARLVAAGIRVVAGHTGADYATTRAALEAGLCGFTHLFNAMSPLTSREPGVVGAALEDRDSWCGLIADGHHVHPATLRIALAARPRGKCVLVTDAMPPVGSEQATYTVAGQAIVVREGVCMSADGVLAGSALDMASAVRNAVSLLGVSIEEAARMASTYPAQWLGLQDRLGRIAAGCDADLVSLGPDLHVRETWIGGQHQRH